MTNIFVQEMIKDAFVSAAAKGHAVTAAEISQPLVDGIRGFDRVLAVYRDRDGFGMTILFDTQKEQGLDRCTAIACDSEETAVALKAACAGH